MVNKNYNKKKRAIFYYTLIVAILKCKTSSKKKNKQITAFYTFTGKQKKLLDNHEQLLTDKNIGQKRIIHHKAVLMIKKNKSGKIKITI